MCALLKQYVSSQTGPALIGVKDFSRILRQAGIVNASPDPWIHGYVGPGAMGTEFEADDYDKPTVLCLVSTTFNITSATPSPFRLDSRPSQGPLSSVSRSSL